MDEMTRWAVIPTRGNRPFTLNQCLTAIAPQVDRIVLVDNSDSGTALHELEHQPHFHLPVRQQPPNLSQLWNLGISLAPEDSFVAVLNDDAFVPPGWFDQIVAQMVRHAAAAGGYNGWSGLNQVPGVTPLDQRLPGHAFILDNRVGLRADEQFQWWCGDNDLDMQARLAGGTAILAPDRVVHMFPDRSTAETPGLRDRAAEDMRLFVEKWGFRPWVA